MRMNEVEIRNLAALITLAIMVLLWWFGVLPK